MESQRRNIAIACQGGGSQTAFTAGVLKSFFDQGIQNTHRIVSFSGTSGGAICATLAWYDMIKSAKSDTTPNARRLSAFWEDNATQYPHEDLFNDWMIGALQLIDSGCLPHWETSLETPMSGIWPGITAMLPHPNFYNFRSLLETHIDFAEIRSWGRIDTPALLIGAANVLTGDFKKFSSLNGEIQVEALLASAAVPTLFSAVTIGADAYWDGLFSDNPPTDELLDEELVGGDNLPDEIWIIQINPVTCDRVPRQPKEIADRRNEMIGNQSLLQDLQKITMINRFLEKGAFTPEFQAKYRPVRIRMIEMPSERKQQLDYATKLDRNRRFIKGLMADGERQGRQFLQEIAAEMASTPITRSDMLSDITSDIPLDIPSDIPPDIPPDIPSDIPVDISSDIPSDIPSDISPDIPSDIVSDIPSGISADVPPITPPVKSKPVKTKIPKAVTTKRKKTRH